MTDAAWLRLVVVMAIIVAGWLTLNERHKRRW